mgnify:CR=1 FL=1
MKAVRKLITNQRQFLAVFSVIALSLAVLGMRTPNLSRPHSPKPTHRAVIEYTAKSVQQSAFKDVIAGEIVCNKIRLISPPARKLQPSRRHDSIHVVAITYISSRAPPLPFA